jgi:hypothetical protein
MNFYFNISMDSTYTGKYSTLMFFDPITNIRNSFIKIYQ